MFIHYEDVIARNRGNSKVYDYITKEISDSLSLILVVSSSDDPGQKSMSPVSDRVYYVLEGTGIAEVDNKRTELKAGDAVYIPKSTTYSIQGNMKYIVVNSPPFGSSSGTPANRGN